jgi:PTS system nitrogen regulatory IIA component
MELADILSEDSVLVYDRVKDKGELLQLIADQAAKLTGHDSATINETLEAREALGSTGLGNGIAIPHGKLPGLGGVMAIFVKLGEPIDFDAVDDEKVDLVMLLLAPAGAGADHLKALARVARLLRTESLVTALRGTNDPARLHALLTAPLSSQNAA